MTIRRAIISVALAAMVGAQLAPVAARAENAMGYRLLPADEAARLPNNDGALGLDVAPSRQISDAGLTFKLMQVSLVRPASAAAQAGLRTGDQIVAVNGRVFPTTAAFAAYLKSLAPGKRATIDYIPAGSGPRNAQRVAIVMGQPAYGGTQNSQAQERSGGMSTRTKIGLGVAGLVGCYYLGCFSGSGSSSPR